ncbi:DUF4313 domain-containing protein [Dysgonomonas sp. GY75]|uniref:DUF4313 domain-containing protein n=1 Tax=Dysgonomonas sp. GY75 TaxID=2780419 RepID=UPI0018838D9A|nr:DUF4313 domain-containing protein [Dysgonomonas sp. GY75]MBF0648729.1 DUF4313 domain-containing protein [Dysgonomonas sp. GY75]
METKQVTINGIGFTLLRYRNKWVFPKVNTYLEGLGSPIVINLITYEKGELIDDGEYITVNLPDCSRNAGCQFIDTNNKGEEILDWLEQNQLGIRTDKTGKSGFCIYPLFDFYKGEKFWEYKEFCEKVLGLG